MSATDPSFKVTLDITAQSESAVTAFAIEHLSGKGYHVTPVNEKWERVCDFLHRIKLANYNSFHCSLAQWFEHGNSVELRYASRETGEKGRPQSIKSNAAFEAFCLRHKAVTKKPTKTHKI